MESFHRGKNRFPKKLDYSDLREVSRIPLFLPCEQERKNCSMSLHLVSRWFFLVRDLFYVPDTTAARHFHMGNREGLYGMAGESSGQFFNIPLYIGIQFWTEDNQDRPRRGSAWNPALAKGTQSADRRSALSKYGAAGFLCISLHL